VIVKSLAEEASLGLSQSSVVHALDKLTERVQFMHESIASDALVEEFIEGREITQAVMGSERLVTFPTWELDISGLPDTAQRIATYKVKWDLDYQKRHGVELRRAENLSEHLEAHIKATSKRIYRALKLSGYARMDYRLTPDNKLYFLEANPNPDIAADDDFAMSAAAAGVDYPSIIQKILNQGIRDGNAWQVAS
jgi:D-alanine-D-alanine ligase